MTDRKPQGHERTRPKEGPIVLTDGSFGHLERIPIIEVDPKTLRRPRAWLYVHETPRDRSQKK